MLNTLRDALLTTVVRCPGFLRMRCTTKKQSNRMAAPSPACRDKDLIARVLAGERELFHELVRPYEKSVYRVIRPLLRNEQESEDVAQETILKALKNVHRFRAESKFSTWLVSIAKNEARIRLRRERNLKFHSLDHAADHQGTSFSPAMIADSRELPLQALERKDLRQMLQRAIARLPEKYRDVLLLRDVEEFSNAETAAVLGVTANLVKTRLFRAKIKMQKILTHSLGSPRAQVRNENESVSVLRMWLGRECVGRSKRLRTHSRRQGSCNYVELLVSQADGHPRCTGKVRTGKSMISSKSAPKMRSNRL